MGFSRKEWAVLVFRRRTAGWARNGPIFGVLLASKSGAKEGGPMVTCLSPAPVFRPARTCARSLAAPSVPELCERPALSTKRAQGMPGEGLTHGPRAVKKHGEGTTGSAKSSGIPCAMGYGLYALSPVRRACWPPSPARSSSRALDTSVGVPGPHDFAVRADDARRASPSRPSHPRLTCRDDRPKRPSSTRRDASIIVLIFIIRQGNYFSARGWTENGESDVICPSGGKRSGWIYLEAVIKGDFSR